MKECWINVYQYPSKKVMLGERSYSKGWSATNAVTAIKNGCKLLYRIHVKLK